MADTLEVTLRLRCYVRQDGDQWVAGCPHLDLYSQGETLLAAREALREAIELWMDSCVERNTLGEALLELGWRRTDRSDGGIDFDADEEAMLGEPFPISITLPAYQTTAALSHSAAR